jgi:hypothetical protein
MALNSRLANVPTNELIRRLKGLREAHAQGIVGTITFEKGEASLTKEIDQRIGLGGFIEYGHAPNYSLYHQNSAITSRVRVYIPPSFPKCEHEHIRAPLMRELAQRGIEYVPRAMCYPHECITCGAFWHVFRPENSPGLSQAARAGELASAPTKDLQSLILLDLYWHLMSLRLEVWESMGNHPSTFHFDTDIGTRGRCPSTGMILLTHRRVGLARYQWPSQCWSTDKEVIIS